MRTIQEASASPYWRPDGSMSRQLPSGMSDFAEAEDPLEEVAFRQR